MVERLPDDDLRVGNPERERAIALLNDAFASGYLEIAEFEERSGLVYTAKTRGELRTVLAQLPNAGMLFPGATAPVPAHPGMPPLPQLHLEADWGEVRRKGVWEVPPSVLATASLGTIDLDFTMARLSAPSISLQLQVATSTVRIRVGPDQDIRYADLQLSGWSKVKDKAGPPTRPGGPVIDLAGSASAMTSVVLKRG